MLKKAILSLSAFLCLGTLAKAQHCGTDEVRRDYLKLYPQIAQNEAILEQQIQQQLKQMDLRKLAKGTADSDTVIMHIPVVVHVTHNYGTDFISDNQIFEMINRMNVYYNKKNADTAQVIAPFKPYIGNMRIMFHLATKDPNGNPTRGITRRFSYHALGGDEAAKFDIWPPSMYLNIWTLSFIGRSITNGEVLAYATPPSSGAANPFGDGVLAKFSTTGPNTPLTNTIEHEVGHYFNLMHPWNSSGKDVGQDCGDDGVDDTPPTKGHFSTCPLYDSVCASGYVRGGIDYPDTTNVQNIMDYSSCTVMFTKGQAARSRAALRANAAHRDSLWSPYNLSITGALDARPDLPPVADFSIDRPFVCADGATPVYFTNRSWNDTITTSTWTFSNGASQATVNSTATAPNAPNIRFTQPGWVTASLTANSVNHKPSVTNVSNSITKNNVVYAADTTTITPEGYFQEFNTAVNNDLDKYPIFNTYDVMGRWQVVNNAGFYDNTSIRFYNYDPRPYGYGNTQTLSPQGNVADFYTRAFNLANMGGTANLNFMSSGAFRTINPLEMNDTLEVAYSSNCGTNWVSLGRLTRTQLGNNANVPYQFVPGWQGAWKGNSFLLPVGAKSSRVYFRFRFKSGSDKGYYPMGTGNHFYIDRIQITNNALGMSEEEFTAKGMILAPNPTSGSATITLKGGDNSLAQVVVTDIAGKVVYRTEARLTNTATQLEIPAANISVKGMYMVQAVTNGRTFTQKLVVF